MVVERITGLKLLKRIKYNEINNECYTYRIVNGKYNDFAIHFGENCIPYISMFGREEKITIEDILEMVICIETKIKEDDEEEEEKIDIQAIEEICITQHFIPHRELCENIEKKINDLTKAVKQLDRKSKEDK